MKKPRIEEVVVVEGRYDRNMLLQVVDATVVETGGFAVFNDREKLHFLRKLAEKRGLILLTDSDGAGFVIRNYLKGALPKERIKQAYIPDVFGKERRKRKAGKEGKLGVEGMTPEILLEALRRSGRDLNWVKKQAAARKLLVEEVYLMVACPDGSCDIIAKERDR